MTTEPPSGSISLPRRQERRLAGAVRRDERGALPDGERERDVVEERIARVTEA